MQYRYHYILFTEVFWQQCYTSLIQIDNIFHWCFAKVLCMHSSDTFNCFTVHFRSQFRPYLFPWIHVQCLVSVVKFSFLLPILPVDVLALLLLSECPWYSLQLQFLVIWTVDALTIFPLFCCLHFVSPRTVLNKLIFRYVTRLSLSQFHTSIIVKCYCNVFVYKTTKI